MLSDELMETRKFYVICTTPRSGSNLLCDLLWSCGAMGKPQEYLNIPDILIPLAKKYNLIDAESKISFDEYMSCMIQNFSSPNNVFGMKFLFDQFEPLMDLQAIKKVLQRCKFIWLVRRDVVAQAVSMYIAKRTNHWSSHTEDKSKRKSVEYNEEKIAFFVKYLSNLNFKWTEFLSVNQAEYLEIIYEELLVDTNKICRDICNFCEVKIDREFFLEKATVKKQGDDLNQKFADIFRNNSRMNLGNQGNFVAYNFNEIKII
jgi:LPS sulfotransferase NodH